MHSPKTVAFEIYLGKKKKKNGNYRDPFITIWHCDPEKDGTDDSCGWSMRARHGNKEIKDKIRMAISSDFDSTFMSDNAIYFTGYFKTDGEPNMSTMGITLGMFYKAVHVHYNFNWGKAQKFMSKNLFKILHFAENPIDSLCPEINGTYRKGTNSVWNRDTALDEYVSIIYGWILRADRPWYKHPKWHIHHWSITFPIFASFRRSWWDKCSVCGKRGFKSSAIGQFNSNKIWHQECDSVKNSKTFPGVGNGIQP